MHHALSLLEGICHEGLVMEAEDEDAWTKEQTVATRLCHAHQSYLKSIWHHIAVEAFLKKFDLSKERMRLLDLFDF